jgi:hypothetical protein
MVFILKFLCHQMVNLLMIILASGWAFNLPWLFAELIKHNGSQYIC